MKSRAEIIKESTYVTAWGTKGYFLAALLGNEYHQSYEWQFLKDAKGKKLTEDEYMLHYVFYPHWSIEMLQELLIDIDEVLHLPSAEADVLLSKMTEGGMCDEKDIPVRLANITKVVKIVLDDKKNKLNMRFV